MMKKIGILFFALAVMLPAAGWAASFDCAKTQTKVEKLICDTPAISKLDEELGKLYQDTLSKANTEQKQMLITWQKHWLKHTRNVCKDEVCLKLDYWSRQAELETFFEPKSPLYKHEADKAEAIKEVLATAPLYYSAGTDSAINQFCNQMFDDLKQMKGISFVDPVVQTQSYEDPALDKWKQRCEAKPPLHFSYACESRIFDTIKSYKDALESPGCGKGFGLPPFKLYELPPEESGGKPRTILYSDEDFGSNVWDYSNSYTAEHWERIKPKLGGGYSAGFHYIDIACEHGFFADAGQGGLNGKNYNSIIEYKNQHYFVILHERRYSGSDGSFTSWGLDVQTVAPFRSKEMKICRWSSALKPNTSTQGRK